MAASKEGWEVLAARHGTLTTTRGAVFGHVADDEHDARHVIDYYLWVLRSRTQTVLIDTGFSAEEARLRGRTILRAPAEIYAALGLDSSWDGDIVLTHAHYDHTGHLGLFPKARLHVARAELDHWEDPSIPDRGLASEKDLGILRQASLEGRITEYEADAPLVHGVHLLLAPGHTPGQLMVRVQTPSGVVLLTSDAAHFDEEYETGRAFHAMTDTGAATLTYERIRDMKTAGAEIVTGHQAGLINQYPPASPELGDEIVLVRP